MADTDRTENIITGETAEEEAKRLGISVRTVYRRRARAQGNTKPAPAVRKQTKKPVAAKPAAKRSSKPIPKPASEPAPELTVGVGSEKLLATLVEAWTKMLDIQKEQIQRMDKTIELLTEAINALAEKK